MHRVAPESMMASNRFVLGAPGLVSATLTSSLTE
jgi:hypothetical protein